MSASSGADEFDVVVGAGSAGCALAGRLTEDPSLRVLLEAGGTGTTRPSRRPEDHDRPSGRPT